MHSDSGARDVGLGISEHACTQGCELLIGFREKLGYTYFISKNVVGENGEGWSPWQPLLGSSRNALPH